MRWLKNGSFGFACVSACAVGAQPNVLPKAFGMRRDKIVFKKVRWKKNKKHRVGNACRLTRCPFMIWSVCWSLVKMVYFFLLIVCLSKVVVSSFTLAPNGFAAWRRWRFLPSRTYGIDAENQCLINHKCVCGALNRSRLKRDQTAVISRFSCLRH